MQKMRVFRHSTIRARSAAVKKIPRNDSEREKMLKYTRFLYIDSEMSSGLGYHQEIKN
jgi:hypothetical protein